MSTLRPGDVLENRYRIDRLLGEGGMSWVYRGHHLLLEQPVAVKVVKPLYSDPAEACQHVEQLRVEAGIMAKLDHPNLVRAFDMFSHGDESVLILEMVEGRNLDQVAQLAPKPISERRVLAWAAQILDALEYLHSQQPPVIVRDLKPGNIMLGQDGRIRLIDFGLAKRMDAQGSGTRAIVRGMGSEGYAPLEQYAHTSTDGRSDLYALGATMYFLLAKRIPPSASLRVVDDSPLYDPRQVNPSLREGTWRAVQSLLALRADDRPANAAAARVLLGLAEAPAVTRSGQPEAESGLDKPAPRSVGKRCVSCDLLLYPVINSGIEIDCCHECGGVWLDRGELGRLVELGRQSPGLPRRSAGFRHSSDQPAEGRPKGSGRLGDVGSRRTAFPSQAAPPRSRPPSQRENGPVTSGLHRVWKMLEDLFD